MNTKAFERLPIVAAALLVVVVVAACAIRLRDDESPSASSPPTDQSIDPLATKLAACRSVTYEQKDALSECRKAWAEQRRQFLGRNTPSASTNGTSSPLFVLPKDESRLPAGYPTISQPEKE
jgi:conjugative transfer region protein TrbK